MQKLLRHALWSLPLSSVIGHIHLPLPLLSLLLPLIFLLSVLSAFPLWTAFLFSKWHLPHVALTWHFNAIVSW